MSPVLYSRAPGTVLNGSGTNRSAVSSGRFEVAPGHPGPAEVELTGDPDRHRLEPGVEDVGGVVRQGRADRQRVALGAGALEHRGAHRGLGGAVAVDEPQAGTHPAVHQRGRQRFAPGDDDPQVGELLVGQEVQHGRRQAHEGDAGAADELGQPGRGQQRLGAAEDERGPREQRAEDVQHRHVEVQRRELEHPVTGAERPVGDLAEGEVDRLPVLDQHSLRTAGRTGRVDDVRHVARIDRVGGIGVVERRQRGAVTVDVDDVGGGHRHDRRALLIGHDDRQLGVLDHEGEPVGRVFGVQRDVAGPGLQHREQCRDPVRRALHADADELPRAGTEPVQPAGDPVGPPVQLGVAQVGLGELHGDGVRGRRNLPLEHLVQARHRERRGGVVALDDLAPPVGRRQQRQPRQGSVFVVDDAVEQHAEVVRPQPLCTSSTMRGSASAPTAGEVVHRRVAPCHTGAPAAEDPPP